MIDGSAGLRRLGVTGTDTGIGKTVVTCALAARARQLGVRVAAMKPVESGVDTRRATSNGLHSDADRLRAACGGVDHPALVCPYALAEPLAPMVAAQRAGLHLDVARLDQARAELEQERDLLLVEGAGGLLVPLLPTLSVADLFHRWSCDVLIVAGNRLGVLNHVMLTVQAAEAAGLTVAGVVLTAFSDRDPSVAEATNFDVLRQLLPQQVLLRFPWVDRVDDFAALAVAAAAAGLDQLLPGVPSTA